MAMSGALLLVLAVAAGLTDLCWCATVPATVSLAACPITYFGQQFSSLHVSYQSPYYKFCFINDAADDKVNCIQIDHEPPLDTFAHNPGQIVTAGSTLHQNLNNIQAIDSLCATDISFESGVLDSFTVTFHSFGSQAAVHITFGSGFSSKELSIEVLLGQTILDNYNFLSKTDGFFDISGCRLAGGILKPNTQQVGSETCVLNECSATAVFTERSTCGRTEECTGDGRCAGRFVCSVTGSTVVDFFGRVHSVPDRCEYDVLSFREPFTIFAGFRERRRQDVPFLDYLTIDHYDMTITLGQGGLVEVDDVIQTINETLEVRNVTFLKDQTGVTVNLPRYKLTVFFDGYTAHMTTHAAATNGLCGNAGDSAWTPTLTSTKSSDSPNGCDDPLTDIDDSRINCNHTTKHCEVMNQGPFVACHNYIDPEPYITACTNTLCNYPEVDGLRCQFLEAYAKACYLKAGITLDWRSDARCPAVSAAFCPDLYCSHNEFCGKEFDSLRCLCRAVFASKYKPTDSLGEPTVCRQTSATVVLAGCLLEEKGIDYSTLHLQDKNCRGHMDSETHMLTFRFNNSNCGTEIRINNSQIIYQNAIMMRNSTNSTSDVITREDQVQIDFSCIYKQPGSRVVAFKIMDGSVVQQLVFGIWNYTLTMNAYTDAARYHLVKEDTEIHLNQRVWLELKTEKLEGNMIALVTESCWATSEASSTSLPKYDLIIGGCPNPNDNTVKMQANGRGTSNYFSFTMFQFSGKDGQIYLHCKVKLCVTKGNNCAPNCNNGARRRRSLRTDYAQDKPTLITMGWNY